MFLSVQTLAACYADVTVNWIAYPEGHDGLIDEKAISVSFSGTNTTGNHQASFRNLSDKKLSAIMAMLLTAKTTKNKLNVYCSNDSAGYTAHSVLLKQ